MMDTNLNLTQKDIVVLVVEDNSEFRNSVVKLIDRKIAPAHGVSNGKEAIEFILEHQSVFCLIDFHLPDMNAKDLVQILQDQNIDLPFIVMTALSSEKDAVEMMKLGAMDYIVKDGNFYAQLPKLIERYLDMHVMEKKLAQSEEALKASRIQYQELFDTSLDAIFICNNDRKITDYNDAFKSIFGYNDIEIKDLDCADLFESIELSERVFALYAKDAQLRNLECTFKRSDGSSLYGLLTSSFIKDNKGNLIGFQSIIKDISEQKQAHEDLKYRIEYEEIVNAISSYFISLPIDESEKGIAFALEQVGEFSRTDRCQIFRIKDDTSKATCMFEWCANGIDSQISKLKNFNLKESYPFLDEVVSDNRIFYSEDIETLPQKAETDKQNFFHQGIKSILVVPLASKGQLVGFISLDSVKATRNWSDDIIALLTICGELITHTELRKEAKQALMENERRMATLMKNLPGMAYRCAFDEDWTFEFISEGCLDLTGYYVDELKYKKNSYSSLIHSDDTEYVKNKIRSSIVNHKPFHLQYRIISKQGTEKWIWEQGTGIYSDDNEPIAFESFAIDISKRKNAEDVKDTINMLSQILLSSQSYADISKRAIQLLGERLGFDFSAITTFDDDLTSVTYTGYYFSHGFDGFPDVLPLNQSINRFAIINGETIFCDNINSKCEYQTEYLRKYNINAFILAPLKNKDYVFGSLFLASNKPREELIALKDTMQIISNMIAQAIIQKKNEEEIFKLNTELEQRVQQRTSELNEALNNLQAEIAVRESTESILLQSKEDISVAYKKEKELHEMKNKFISMISHEYRTPLTVILTSTFIIERYLKSMSMYVVDKHIDKIQSAVQTMTGLLEEVLLIGRLESGNYTIDTSPIELNSICQKIIEEYQIVDNKSHDWEFISSKEELVVFSNEHMLRQVIGNLISNAIKYSPANTRIRVDTSFSTKGCKIKVIDQGPGIPQSDYKHIFEPFYRGTNTISIPGTGLGLAIVKKSIDMLKGSITLRSIPNKGTTFTVCLPK